MLVAGDIFDSGSTPSERNAAIDVFRYWAQDFPVVAIYGNHEIPGDLDFLAHLRTKNEVTIRSRPSAEGMVRYGGAVIAALPWPRKSALVAKMAATSALDVNRAAGEAMRAILLGYAAAFAKEGGPRIILGHLELGAATADSGQPMVGRCDIDVVQTDLKGTGADAILLGHIHRAQTIGDRIRYAGSPRQTSFGEEGLKGYSLVTVERGKPPVIEHRHIPSRQLITIGLDDKAPDVTRASVRLVYETSEDARQQTAERAEKLKDEWIAAGAHSFKIDARTIATSRVRSLEVQAAKTMAEKVDAYWTAKGVEFTRERALAILGKLSEIESAS
jgi:DNA repair exonuclease SbcCD nuclease subunit